MPPENVKTRLKESNVPPLNNEFESNMPQLFIIDSRTFVAKSALSRLRAFWGALLAKIWWEGAQKHFKGPGPCQPSLSANVQSDSESEGEVKLEEQWSTHEEM